MAFRPILTTTTLPFDLDSFDEFYVGRNASITPSNASGNAVANRLPTDFGISISVDGSVISGANQAIRLSGPTSSTSGNDTILIGDTGIVRSLGYYAIVLLRSNETIINHGLVEGDFGAVSASGNDTSIRNTGTIGSRRIALQVQGNRVSVDNDGEIFGSKAVSHAGDAQRINNTGLIAGGSPDDPLSFAVKSTAFLDAKLFNSGTITSAQGHGVQSLGLAGSEFALANSGTIHGAVHGVFVEGTDSRQSAAILNSGLIEGHDSAVRAEKAAVRIVNGAEGILQATTLDTVWADQILRLVNDGEILSSGQNGHAIVLGAGSASSSIVNRGTISAASDTAFDASLLVTGVSISFRNFGAVSGSYVGAEITDIVINRGLLWNLSTGAGADLVRNFGAIDAPVVLGDGNDRYLGRFGHLGDALHGGAGNDTLIAGIEDDSLYGEAGNDSILGGDGNDVLIGGFGADRILGGAGDDVIVGGVATGLGLAGDRDVMTGGSGADIFLFRSALEIGTGASRDWITDFAHNEDDIDLSALMAGGSYIGAAAFAVNGLAQVRYVAATGLLSGDVTGNGVEDWQMQLAANLTLTSGDFRF